MAARSSSLWPRNIEIEDPVQFGELTKFAEPVRWRTCSGVKQKQNFMEFISESAKYLFFLTFSLSRNLEEYHQDSRIPSCHLSWTCSFDS